MKDAILYLREQIKYFPIAFNMSSYSTKSTSMQNRLGRIWEIMDPLFQLGIYYLIFGVLIKRVVPGYPTLPWMIIGMGVYGFAQKIITVGSTSISKQFSLASKMKFPISIIPTASMIGFLTEFFVMVGGGFTLAIFNGYAPSLYWFQILYYFFALVMFSLSMSLLNSSISVVFPDFKFFLNYFFRFMVFGSGAIFSLAQFKQIPEIFIQSQLLNPFYYLIEGFRNSAFGDKWFWQDGMYNLAFWMLTLVILILGANTHMKIRDRISDYL